MPSAPMVFISYSHKDEVWKDRLLDHLGVLEEDGHLKVWNDRNIGAGNEWFEEIRNAMDAAKVAVFLVSANSLKSKFIRHKEIPHLLERRGQEGMTFIPVIVKACVWHEFPWLNKLLAMPRDGRALASFRGNPLDAELAKIATEILGFVRNEAPNYSPNSPSLPKPLSELYQGSVSTGSSSVLERQLQIAERYNKILEAQMQPLFRFVPTTRSIGSDSFDAMELWNDGASMESCRIFQHSYLQVTRPEESDDNIPRSSTRLIPFCYFERRDYEGDTRSGLLVTFYAWRDPIGTSPGINLTKEYLRLRNEIWEKYEWVNIEKRVFILINYTDRIGTNRNTVFEMYPPRMGYGPQLPLKSTSYPGLTGGVHQLASITATNLFELWHSSDDLT